MPNPCPLLSFPVHVSMVFFKKIQVQHSPLTTTLTVQLKTNTVQPPLLSDPGFTTALQLAPSKIIPT
jgi:hypothetical protein